MAVRVVVPGGSGMLLGGTGSSGPHRDAGAVPGGGGDLDQLAAQESEKSHGGCLPHHSQIEVFQRRPLALQGRDPQPRGDERGVDVRGTVAPGSDP